MKQIILALIILGPLVYFAGCSKSSNTGISSCTGFPVDHDSSALLAFAKTNNITPVRDSTGLYYQVITPGTGTTPLPTSIIYVTYTAEFMNGDIFDSTTNSATTGFVLNTLINGWQIGLPKIQTGGRIKMLIPSALAYGCTGSGTTIPPNTPVYFDVTLVSLQ